MKLDACDLCHAEGELVLGTVTALRVDTIEGTVDLCPGHLAALEGVLQAFHDVARIAATEAGRRCPECGFVSASKDASSKHRRMHSLARDRGASLAAAAAVPTALAATG